MLAVVIEDGLRLGEPFPRSLIHVLPHWSSEFIPGSTFSDLLERRQDVAAHHSQSEHAPRVRSRSGNVFYGVGLETAPPFSSTSSWWRVSLSVWPTFRYEEQAPCFQRKEDWRTGGPVLECAYTWIETISIVKMFTRRPGLWLRVGLGLWQVGSQMVPKEYCCLALMLLCSSAVSFHMARSNLDSQSHVPCFLHASTRLGRGVPWYSWNIISGYVYVEGRFQMRLTLEMVGLWSRMVSITWVATIYSAEDLDTKK